MKRTEVIIPMRAVSYARERERQKVDERLRPKREAEAKAAAVREREVKRESDLEHGETFHMSEILKPPRGDAA